MYLRWKVGIFLAGVMVLPFFHPYALAAERYPQADTSRWIRDALAWDAAPVNLSFLNRDDRPAGGRGAIRADGDQFVRGDGTPVRFWGGNLVAGAIFSTPRESVVRHTHRMAQLGFNLMRIHHHDSDWVNPNLIDRRYRDSRHLNASSLDSLDWWIKCLKDEGIYVWLDMNVGRVFKPGDGITEDSTRSPGPRVAPSVSVITTRRFKS